MKDTVMVISPHQDDETIGAGGTLLRYKELGCKVHWLNITDMKEEYGYAREAVEKRKKELELVKKEFQFDGVCDFGLRTGGLDEYPLSDLIAKISGVFKKVEPNILILPYHNDVHSDHRIVTEAVSVSAKTFRHPFIKRILMMEVISETDFSIYGQRFSPNYFVDITDYIKKKISIMNLYQSEVGDHPFPRSSGTVEALAMLRGSQAGCAYAEAFMLLKEIT